MATFTTRLILRKPAGIDQVSVSTDLGDNFDKLDNAVGFLECTSSTRPSTPFNGQAIRESDTDRFYASNGSSPASGSWTELWNPETTVPAVNILTPGGGSNAVLSVLTTGTIGGNRLFNVRVESEVHASYIVDFDGKTRWGPGGSTEADTNLYRSAADTLKTDDNFIVGTNLTVNGTIAATAAAMTSVQSATNTTAGTTTSTTATDSLTSSSTVTQGFTVPPSGKVRVTISGEIVNSGANYTTLSFRISGSAGTVAHDDNNGFYVRGTNAIRGSATSLITGLTPGATGTVTLSHLVTGGTGTFNRRRILVEPAF